MFVTRPIDLLHRDNSERLRLLSVCVVDLTRLVAVELLSVSSKYLLILHGEADAA